MRIVFMGTPDFSVPTFEALLQAGHQIVACYTKAPRPAGRGQQEKKSPVHMAAEAAGIPVFTPKSLKGAKEQELFVSHGADVAVVVAYGLILPKPVLDAPVHNCLNLHGSRLPRWRGAAPIQRAIMAGDRQSAVQVMAMEEGLDTGPIALSADIEIDGQMNAGELHDEMMTRGAALMVQALDQLENGELVFTPQSEQGATYASKILKSETRIDWRRSANEVHDLVRGLSPFPGAWCLVEVKGKPVRLKILRTELAEDAGGTMAPGPAGQIIDDNFTIACGSGALRILQLQRAGKGVMSTEAFLLGAGSLHGQILESG